LTISTGQKYATCGNRLEPVTFQWIIENDPDYIKSVLTRVRKLKNRNMQQLYMYLREHYQPESWKKWNALENIEEQLAEWRQNMADVAKETHAKYACQLDAQAAVMTQNAVKATAESARATAAAAWMTTEAARVTAHATRTRTAGSLNGEATMQPQHKKAKI